MQTVCPLWSDVVTAPMPDSAEPTIDGRRARRHRSRDLAVDALLDLLGEGVLRPTAQQVAERSGVSLRSIFRIFDDVESLNAAAAARQLSRVRHLFVDVLAHRRPRRPRRRDGGDQRPPLRVGRADPAGARCGPHPSRRRSRSSSIGRASGSGTEVERVFADELADAGRDTAAAVELALSFEAWDQLRSAQGVSGEPRWPPASRSIVTALLEPHA